MPKTIIVRPVRHDDQGKLDLARNPKQLPVFEVVLAGPFKHDEMIHLDVGVAGATLGSCDRGGEKLIGEVRGRVGYAGEVDGNPYYRLHPITIAHETRKDVPRVGFLFEDGAVDPVFFPLPIEPVYRSSATPERRHRYEGDCWDVQLRLGRQIRSPAFNVAWTTRPVPNRFTDQPEAAYAWHSGAHVSFYCDASKDAIGSAGAFHDIAAAIEDARHFIFIVDWSFHPVTTLDPRSRELRDTLGARLLRKASQGVRVAIHTWRHSAPLPGMMLYELANEEADAIMRKMAETLGLPFPEDNLMWRGSARGTWWQEVDAALWSHHQKFVVVDAAPKYGDAAKLDRRDLKVFFGGLDLTKGRFDWPEHPILPEDPQTRGFREPITHLGRPWQFESKALKGTFQFDDWYNGEFGVTVDPEVLADDRRLHPRQPWHDIHAQTDGAVAWDFVREFVARWLSTEHARAGRDDKRAVDLVWNTFDQVIQDRTRIIPQWEWRASPGPWNGQLLRSMSFEHVVVTRSCDRWHPKRMEFVWKTIDYQDRKVPQNNIGREPYERSIQESYVRAIRSAERFVYIENQYFIGSGAQWGRPGVKNNIPHELVARIEHKVKAAEPFHVYIVLPMVPEGPTAPAGDNATQSIRNLTWKTIASMIVAVKKILADRGSDKTWDHYVSFYFPALSQRFKGHGHFLPRGTPMRLTDFRDLPAWRAYRQAQRDYDDNPKNSGLLSYIRGDKKPVPPPQAELRKAVVMANKRYMIYVHSKLMIVDDRYVILGSANINERSLAGNRDSEICVALWPADNRAAEKLCEEQVQVELRGEIWRDHLGPGMPKAFRIPESPDCYRAVHKEAQLNYVNFRGGLNMAGHLCMFPFDADEQGTWKVPDWAAGLYHDPGLTFLAGESLQRNELLPDPADDSAPWTWTAWVTALGGWPFPNQSPHGLMVE